VTRLSDQFGGPATVFKNAGQVLAYLGHDVSYWATGDERDREELASIQGVHVYDVNRPRFWRRSRGLSMGLASAVPSLHILHVYGLWLHPTYAASWLAHAHEVPYILRPAGCLEPWRLRRGFLRRLKKSVYLNLVGRPIVERAACLHACSTQEAHHFRLIGYKGPIVVIPNGVDIGALSPGDGTEAEEFWPELRKRPVVLFMSRLSPEKGLDLLIPLWADLVNARADRDAILVVAGPDDRGYGKTVGALIDRRQLRSHVLMTGMVRGQKKLALLRRADIFILPSYSENFGIVVAEALACGAPVITTTGTPWQELTALDAGRWIRPERTELGCALRELLDMSDSQRRKMGQAGRALVEERYTWDVIVRKYLTLYDCVLQGKSIPSDPEPMSVSLA